MSLYYVNMDSMKNINLVFKNFDKVNRKKVRHSALTLFGNMHRKIAQIKEYLKGYPSAGSGVYEKN